MRFIVSLNDTVAMNDTIVVKIMKVVENCQPVINESETNCNDLWIVISICATVVMVVGFVTWVLYTWISGKNKLRMTELEQRGKVSEIEFKKQEQGILIEKWEAEDKREESKLHRERYQQETDRIRLDAELERKIRDKESENEKN